MSFFNVAAGERRGCAVITRLPVYGSAEQWKASGQGFCVHEPEVQTQSRSREHTSDRIFAKLLREGLCQALETITGRAAATGRSSAANLLQKLRDIRPSACYNDAQCKAPAPRALRRNSA